MTEETTAVVATASQYEKAVKRVKLPKLTAEDMASARQIAAGLVPNERTVNDIVTLGAKSRTGLAAVARRMLDGVTVGDLEKATNLSNETLTTIEELDVVDLNPKAKNVLETARAIARRVKRFFERYQQINSRLDKIAAQILSERTSHTETYHNLAELYKQNQQFMLDLRIALAAGGIYRDETGMPELDRLQIAADEEVALARKEERTPDQLIVQKAADYKSYIERVEMAEAALQQALVSAFQTGIAIRMMMDNENVIRQELYDIEVNILPEWRKLIALAWTAYQQHGIAGMVGKLEDAESELRRKVADQLGQAADEIAAMKKRQIFDEEAMAEFNQKLVTALETLHEASIEAKKIREAAEESGNALMADLSEAVARTAK